MDSSTSVFHLRADERHQTIRHFGASACWWACGLGVSPKRDALLRLLFTDAGLGLNNLRVNIGGSVKADRSDSVNSMPLWRGVLSPLCEDGSYDIRRCSGTWSLVQKALSFGTITDLTLFMNSPPSSMTKNGKTSAEKSGQEGVFVSNLREDCYEAYAAYVAEVTQRYLAAGVPVKYVSPVNEPQWAWEGGQEGCHYEPEELVRLFRLLVREFDRRAAEDSRIRAVRLSLPETAQWYQRPYVHALYRLLATDVELAPHLDHFCAHSYGTTREQKQEFAAYARSLGNPLALHQTEWGPMHPIHDASMDTALELATVLYEDLNILHVTCWSWWLGVGSFRYTDGLICSDTTAQRLVFPKRYFVMKQHSRFLRDHICLGVERLQAAEGTLASAYLREDGQELVWELVNTDDAPSTVRLTGIRPDAAATILETSETYSCEERGVMLAGDSYVLPPKSVTTLIFSDGF